MVATDNRRAQLILVGAVSLALIIIGLTVVLNTVLFTSTVTTDVTVDASDDALRFDQTAREGTRSLILRMNHGEKNFSRPQLRDSVVRNVTNYTRLLRESYTVSRPVFVNVSYNGVTYGQRVVQSEDGTFESPTTPSASNWAVIDDGPGERAKLGRFIVNLNVSGMSNDEFNVTIRNGSDSVDIGVQRNTSGGATAVDIGVERTHGPDTGTVQCLAVRGRVLLDVLNGESFNSECAFNATENMAPPYDVRIEDGDNANGRYSLVARSNVSANPGLSYDFCGSGLYTDVPCQVPAIWSTNVTMAYSSTEIDYERNHNLSIYP